MGAMLRSTAAAALAVSIGSRWADWEGRSGCKTAQAEAAPASHVRMAHLPGTLSAHAVSERFAYGFGRYRERRRRLLRLAAHWIPSST
jgi:hypothetical protein